MSGFDQKKSLRLMCKIIYYLGVGNFWYEVTNTSSIFKGVYNIFSGLIKLFLVTFYLDQWLGILRKFTEMEANAYIITLVGNTVILGKLFVFLSLKSRLKLLLERLPEDPNITKEYEKASLIKALKYGATYCILVYFVLLFKTITAMIEGEVFNLEVVYYPSPATPGILGSFLRFIAAFHWWFLLILMCIMDIFTTLCLIISQYRFKTLQSYFKNLGNKVDKKIKEGQSIEDIREEYYKDFVEGIKMHEEALWCARNVQCSLGNVYSIQILATISLLTIHLLKIVSIQRHVLESASDLTYIAGLTMMCGAYMTSAGDVTHEAYLLSEYMMHSGVLVVGDRRLRKLVTIAIQRSQIPVHMTAFGVVYLTHSNYIAVIRTSYSFYTVMR